MKFNRGKFKKIGCWLGCLVVVGVLLAALLPLWLPWMLGPALRHYGLSFDKYERIGFRRFTLHGVTGQWGHTKFQAVEVECLQPAFWLWHRTFTATNAPVGLIVRESRLDLSAGTNAPTAEAGEFDSFGATLDQIARIGSVLHRELPNSRLTNLTITFGRTHLTVPAATWADGVLQATAGIGELPESFHVVARVTSRSALAVTVESPERDLKLKGNFTRESGEWHWAGNAVWRTNEVSLTARFTTNSWWPVAGRVASEQLSVPATWVRLKGYQDPTAKLAVAVVSNRFELQATGFALPLSADLPRVEATLRAHGDPDSATLDLLHLQTPWLQADLTSPISIRRNGELLASAAQLDVALNLTNLPGANLHGFARGAVKVTLNAAQEPVAQFDLTAAYFGTGDWQAERVAVRGEFAQPLLKLETATATLADGSQFDIAGTLDVVAREIREARWRARGPFALPWLTNVTYASLEAAGTAQGPLTNLSHAGTLTLNEFRAAAFKARRAKIEWHGEQLRFDSATADFEAGESTLIFKGRLDLNALARNQVTATVENFSLSRKGETLYALQQPGDIVFRRAANTGKTSTWNLTITPLEWRGGERVLSVATEVNWPAQGQVAVTAKHLQWREAADFLIADWGTFTVAELAVNAGWTNGPLHATASATVTVSDPQGQDVTGRGRFSLGEKLQVEQLTLSSAVVPVLTLDGDVPLRIFPGRTNGWLVPDPQQPLTLRASSPAEEKELAVTLGALGKLKISQPRLQIQTSGTLNKPAATIALQAASIDWQTPATATPRPRLDQIRLDAEIVPERLTVRTFTARIDGQLVEANSEWPLAGDFWEKLWRSGEPPDWTRAQGRLRMEGADVAALSRYLPSVLAPEGHLQLDITLAPGGQFGGQVLLTNAATRPLGGLTPLRDIAGVVRLEGQRAILENLQGQMGGQPVRASGSVTIPLAGELDYQVNLRGTNVPLARSLELLLRADLNVQLRGGHTTPTSVTGDVILHDGLYVQHAAAFVWSRPKRPEMQPPYFSITNEPFADWKLDLNVRGDRFLRLRTPFFNGNLSAATKLTGTLGAPHAAGEARVVSGRVIFPFGTLVVDQGYAILADNDSRGPNLRINASGRTMNYEIRMEITGPMDGANLVFSSTPPLNSEEILLMLTAGELPRKEYAFSTQAKAGRLATFLGKDLVTRFTGNEAAEERLIVNTGENISEDGKLTYSVEYKFTERWSIIGEYDRFNAFNADLKWKIFSR